MQQIAPILERIYQTGTVVGRSGRVHELHSEIDRKEGEFLFDLVRNDPTIHRTLEVGCAYGLSALYLCAATRERAGASHTMIDPYQNGYWDGVGVLQLEAAGITNFELIEQKSELALPRLLEAGEGRFDFVFIDGWHTFDHTLLDCFYATRLLRVGGLLAIDDVSFPSVRRVVEFLKAYPCYEVAGVAGAPTRRTWKKRLARLLALPLGRERCRRLLAPLLYRKIFEDFSPSLIALRKTREDERNWDWHSDSF